MAALRQTTPAGSESPGWVRRPASLGKALTGELVERIVRGVHPPGSSLPPEPVLCETFSVSRTVVREAVKILQEKGLVQVRQGAGTMVNPAAMCTARVTANTMWLSVASLHVVKLVSAAGARGAAGQPRGDGRWPPVRAVSRMAEVPLTWRKAP